MDSTLAEDRVRPVLTQHAHSCLVRLEKTNEKPRSEAALRADGGWTVLVIAYPTANGHDESKLALTPCECDCLTLLAQVKRPLSGVRIHRELDRRNIGIYGLATVKRALAHLKRIQLVSNSRTSPRGYYLPESRGLMRQIASR
jgi:hypothetical protein